MDLEAAKRLKEGTLLKTTYRDGDAWESVRFTFVSIEYDRYILAHPTKNISFGGKWMTSDLMRLCPKDMEVVDDLPEDGRKDKWL